MISFKEYLVEFAKNKWQHLLVRDKTEYHQDLIGIVDSAYKHTTLGSFIKSMGDVKSSEWLALDYDKEPDIDVAVFYRPARPTESWIGNKIQGIGHDGERESKIKLMDKVDKLLTTKGWWIEASENMTTALKKKGVQPVTDQELLKRVFPSIIKFNSDHSYERLAGNEKITEFVFGELRLK